MADAASAKIKTLNFCDEIEVVLGFIVAFSREFKLNAQMNNMLYEWDSKITPRDVFETRKKLTNQGFDNETKAIYAPFFLTDAYKKSLKALPLYKKNQSEKDQDSHSFHKFLMHSDAMKLFLKRKYPQEMSSLEARINEEIEEKRAGIYIQLEGLNPSRIDYENQCKWLQQQSNNLPKEVTEKLTQDLRQRFCSENKVDCDL